MGFTNPAKISQPNLIQNGCKMLKNRLDKRNFEQNIPDWTDPDQRIFDLARSDASVSISPLFPLIWEGWSFPSPILPFGWWSRAICPSFSWVLANRKSIIPGRVQMVGERNLNFVENLITENIGEKGKDISRLFSRYLWWLSWGNLLGMLPYSLLIPVTGCCIPGLALLVFFTVWLLALSSRLFIFLCLFPWVSLRLLWLVVLIDVSFISRPVTLSSVSLRIWLPVTF